MKIIYNFFLIVFILLIYEFFGIYIEITLKLGSKFEKSTLKMMTKVIVHLAYTNIYLTPNRYVHHFSYIFENKVNYKHFKIIFNCFK